MLEQASDLSLDGPRAQTRERLEVDGIGLKEGRELFVRVDAEEASDERANGGAADHVWEQALLKQALDNTKVVQSCSSVGIGFIE